MNSQSAIIQPKPNQSKISTCVYFLDSNDVSSSMTWSIPCTAKPHEDNVNGVRGQSWWRLPNLSGNLDPTLHNLTPLILSSHHAVMFTLNMFIGSFGEMKLDLPAWQLWRLPQRCFSRGLSGEVPSNYFNHQTSDSETTAREQKL